MGRTGRIRRIGKSAWSDVGVKGVAKDSEAFDQLLNAAVKVPFGFEASGGDAGVGDNVVALVRILADGGFEEDETRKMFFDDGAEFELGQVGVVQADIVGPAFHGGELIEPMEERAHDVADMDVVALEMALEDDDGAVAQGAMNEVVDQQVHAHPWGHAKNGRQSEADAVRATEDFLLGFDFCDAIEGDRAKRGVFGAVFALFANAA